jgi:hypothetical protein
MSKHTPGPWVAEGEDRETWRIRSEDYGTICRIHDPEGPVEHDAHLIAAAPDLLDALEALLAWQRHLEFRDVPGKEGRSLAYAGDLEIIRAAIAKARGQAEHAEASK